MKIIKVNKCGGYESDGSKSCKYYDPFYDTMRSSLRHFCINPRVTATKFSSHRIIPKKCIKDDTIPDWCPLEDYKK